MLWGRSSAECWILPCSLLFPDNWLSCSTHSGISDFTRYWLQSCLYHLQGVECGLRPGTLQSCKEAEMSSQGTAQSVPELGSAHNESLNKSRRWMTPAKFLLDLLFVSPETMPSGRPKCWRSPAGLESCVGCMMLRCCGCNGCARVCDCALLTPSAEALQAL